MAMSSFVGCFGSSFLSFPPPNHISLTHSLTRISLAFTPMLQSLVRCRASPVRAIQTCGATRSLHLERIRMVMPESRYHLNGNYETRPEMPDRLIFDAHNQQYLVDNRPHLSAEYPQYMQIRRSAAGIISRILDKLFPSKMTQHQAHNMSYREQLLQQQRQVSTLHSAPDKQLLQAPVFESNTNYIYTSHSAKPSNNSHTAATVETHQQQPTATSDVAAPLSSGRIQHTMPVLQPSRPAIAATQYPPLKPEPMMVLFNRWPIPTFKQMHSIWKTTRRHRGFKTMAGHGACMQHK
jgi:hypothetical protein